MVKTDSFENEFLKNRKIHHSSFLRIDNVHEFSEFVKNTLGKLDYAIKHHTIHFLDNDEAKKSLKHKHQASFRITTKASRKVYKGSRFEVLWKIFGLLALGILFYYFLFSRPIQHVFLRNSFILSLLTTLLAYMIKERISVSVWLKSVGVFDPVKKGGIAHTTLAAHSDKDDSVANYHLEENVSEIKDAFNNNFINVKGIKHLINDKSSQGLEENMQVTSNDIKLFEEALANGELLPEESEQKREELYARKHALEISKDLLEL